MLLNKFVRKYYINDIVFNVKYHLKLMNYNSLQFFALPGDMSSGSRELLIALAYLISKDELNNIVLDEIKNTPLDNSYEFQTNLNMKNQKNLNISYDKQCKTTKDCEQLIKWLEGKISYNKQLSKEYNLCTDKLVKKVHYKFLYQFNLF